MDPSRLTGNCCCCLETHATSLPDTQGNSSLLCIHWHASLQRMLPSSSLGIRRSYQHSSSSSCVDRSCRQHFLLPASSILLHLLVSILLATFSSSGELQALAALSIQSTILLLCFSSNPTCGCFTQSVNEWQSSSLTLIHRHAADPFVEPHVRLALKSSIVLLFNRPSLCKRSLRWHSMLRNFALRNRVRSFLPSAHSRSSCWLIAINLLFRTSPVLHLMDAHSRQAISIKCWINRPAC